jgi:CRISPR/Cas system-associated protein Csm6
MTRYILTSVGTSLLTNNAGPLTTLLRDTANLRESDLPIDQRQAIDGRIATVRDLLSAADLVQRRRCSAELNGLHGLCGERLVPDDLHFLLATDTYQGRATADLLCDDLKAHGASSVQVVVPKCLSTRSQADFTSGIREVIRFCEETFGPCHKARVPVLFNLVGSFKSLQGYLNTIGMFYADEILYVFEDPAAELIRIPRLPVTLDLSTLRNNRERFAMLAEGDGWTLPVAEFTGWPEVLWEETSTGSGRAWLSTWGLLLWERGQDELLGDELLELPRLEMSNSFRQDWQDRRANRRERLELQQRLARVAVMLDQSNGDTSTLKRDGSLQYDNYTGANAGIGHFRVNNRGWRVTCTTESGRLRLRRFGPHEINDNP